MKVPSWAALALGIAAQYGFVQATTSPFFSQLQPCPASCSTVGAEPKNWTVYNDVKRLRQCNQTLVFDFNIFAPSEHLSGHTTVRACTVDKKASESQQKSDTASCGPSNSTLATAQVASWGSSTKINSSSVIEATSSLRRQLHAKSSCGSAILFAYSEGTIVGFYGGANIMGGTTVDSVISLLVSKATGPGVSSSFVAQVCGQGRDGQHTLGAVVSTTGDIHFVQAAMQQWNNASCVTGFDRHTSSPITVTQRPEVKPKSSRKRNAFLRSPCSYVQVASGDSCDSLATKCCITDSQFTSFNPSPTLCSTLAVGQPVCCSAGTLPDLAPQPNADGSCAAYTVQAGDYCSLIASENTISVDDIENFNKETWGWQGCSNIQLGQVICLSSGLPPMPVPLSNAICGPQVPGTTKPSDLSTLASLNPCPLNSCCNIWGECGITPDFCTISQSATGAPGTSAPGTNGCISNCGTEVVNNGQAPSNFLQVGYFESWNTDRPCLTMDATQIPSGFTHIHFSFGAITSDFQVDLSGVQDQFNKFVNMEGFKRILSFGGWSFSTSQDSFPIFREGVTSANRLTFAQSVVSVIEQYGLDGVDFDWEYPGAPDIPGITPGSPTDGPNYLDFLQTLRSMIPSGKTISMAAPASYWYLKGFPIKDMAPVLDYIVYMTYDLHGQWDYGSPFSNPGCPTGNCLRSHVNLTETEYSLAMITKAGVPSNKVVVGVSSYGRSFGMTDPGCSGPSCLFNGPDSTAAPGVCTDEAGYLADAEIVHMINQGAQSFHDDTVSDSDIAIFNGTWVAYMSPATKAIRISRYQSQNFGGTVDWAVDLESGSSTTSNGTITGLGSSPNKASIIPIPGCTTLAPSATLTLTPACATAIQAMPPSGMNNDPPGPSFCSDGCDLLQWITGTCCGVGGTIGNPVVVEPGVPLPASLPLQQGFIPPVPITIPATTFPAGEPIPYPLVITKGSPIPQITFPFTSIGGTPLLAPLTIPAGAVPSAPFIVNGVPFAASVPLTAAITFPAGYLPSTPFYFAPFIIPAGLAPVSFVLPLGYIPFVALPVAAITYPVGVPLPLPIALPPGTVFPDPFLLPFGAPLVVPFPGFLPGDTPPPPPPPVTFPLVATECWNLPADLTYTPSPTPPPNGGGGSPSPTPTQPFSCDPTVVVSQLNCNENCCGYISCPSWCNAMCGGVDC